MSRHKNRTGDHAPGDSHHSPENRAGQAPDPPRPNAVFLTAAIILLAVWITFLLILAVAT